MFTPQRGLTTLSNHLEPTMRPPSLKTTLALLAATVTGLVILAGLCTLTMFRNPFNDRPFTATAWAKLDPQERAHMAEDLVRNHLTAGLSQANVHTLLGMPGDVSSRTESGGMKNLGAQTEKYYIGSWSLYGYDDAFVYVHFDGDGKVIAAEIYGY